jgi:hypothetical protein
MSMKRPWYQRYPDHFIAATMHMTFEQKGAYSFLLDLFYAANGKLRDDDRKIAKILRLEPRRWERIKLALLCDAKILIKPTENPQVSLIFPSSFLQETGKKPSSAVQQPIEKVRSTANKPIRREEYIEREKKSISSSSSLSQSAGARAGEMEAPATPAPPEQKQVDKAPQLSEEERAAFVPPRRGLTCPYGTALSRGIRSDRRCLSVMAARHRCPSRPHGGGTGG